MKRRGTFAIILSLVILSAVMLVLWWRSMQSTMTEKLGSDALSISPEVQSQFGVFSREMQRIREAITAATKKTEPEKTLSEDTAEKLEKKLRGAVAKATTWMDYTAPETLYRVSYPSHWTKDTALSSDTAFFARDPNGAFVWITIPALAFDIDAPNKVKQSFSIDATIPAIRVDAEGVSAVTFFYKGKEGLIRIEYNSEDAETYRPIIDRIIQSFTFRIQ